MKRAVLRNLIVILATCATAAAQDSPTATPADGTATVPRLIRYSGSLRAATQQGAAGAIFSIYSTQFDGAPLWSEVRNVTPDEKGGYSVLLGSTRNEGLPIEVFNTSEPRWLEVEINGVKEPRVQIGSVPYAMVAADSQTFGGLPPSAYMRVGSVTGSATSTTTTATGPSSSVVVLPGGPKPAVVSGSAGFLSLFTNSTDLTSSTVFQGTYNSNTSVSIGGTTQLGALTLTGNVPGGDTAGMALYNQGGGAGAAISLDFYNTSFNAGIPQAKIKAADDGNYSANLLFLVKAPGAAGNAVSEKMRLTSTGNLGIGTMTPTMPLDVAGNARVTGNITIAGTGNTITFPDGTALSSTSSIVTPNSQAVAQKRFNYNAILTLTSAAAGAATGLAGLNAPTSITWDGIAYWITNSGANSIEKYNPSTNVTTQITTGTPASSSCFDGGIIWFLFPAVQAIQGLNPVTNAVTVAGTTGANPKNIVCDGTNEWVTNYGNGNGTSVTRFDNLGNAIGTITVGQGPFKGASDGTNVWFTNNVAGTVSVLSLQTGTVIKTIAVGSSPTGICFDSTSMWVMNNTGASVTKINAGTFATTTLTNLGAAPADCAWDGQYIYVMSNSTTNAPVVKTNTSTGAFVASIIVGNSPAGITFDGSNMAVVNGGSNSLSIIKPSIK